MKKWVNILKIVLGAIFLPIILGFVVGAVIIVVHMIGGDTFTVAMGSLTVVIENIAPFMPIISIVTLAICVLPVIIKKNKKD